MRVKKQYRTDSRENYERFLKKYGISESTLSFDKFKKNIHYCNWMYIEYALRTGNKISFPHGFGSLVVTKKILQRYKIHNGVKYNNLRINWQKTKEIGKRVYHTNEHSDGYNYKWLWFAKDSRLRLRHLYVFKACRYASREIAKYVKKKDAQYGQMYLEWPG